MEAVLSCISNDRRVWQVAAELPKQRLEGKKLQKRGILHRRL